MEKIWNYIRRHYLPPTLPRLSDKGLWLTLPFAALLLLIYEFYGWQMPFLRMSLQIDWLHGYPKNSMFFIAQAYTSASFVVLFVILPVIFAKFLAVDHPNPFQYRKGLLREAIPSYLPLILIMTPVLWIICGNESFNRFYPLYQPETLHHLLAYETIYMVQFVAIEYFFRGFLLFRTEKAAPGYGPWIVVIPYALVHVHKPFPEAVGSIVAGIVLGHLALKSRSIWPGVLVHCYIALTTDLLSLFRSGRWSSLF